MNEKKTIVFSTDNNYAQHLGVALQSLLHNNRSLSFHVYILTTDIHDSHIQNWKEIASPYDCELTTIDINEKTFENLQMGRWGKAMYYRLLIPELIKESKVLYLDVDIVVNGPIHEIFETNISSSYLAAVEAILSDTESRKRYLNMTPKAKYFNSGVMLLNLNKWRQDKIDRKLEKFLASYTQLKSPDQDALNAVINGQWIPLHFKYNYYYRRNFKEESLFSSTFDKKELKEASANPVIIHYVGSKKPWHYRDIHPLKHLYWKYLEMTPYRNYHTEDFSVPNFFSKNHARFKRFLKYRFQAPDTISK